MLSGYMTGPRVCGYMHRRQVNTRKHKTELAYIGRAPFKRRPRSPASSLVDSFRRLQKPRAAAKFLGLAGSPRRPHPPPPPPTYTGQTKPKAAASPHLSLLPELPPPPNHISHKSPRISVESLSLSRLLRRCCRHCWPPWLHVRMPKEKTRRAALVRR